MKKRSMQGYCSSTRQWHRFRLATIWTVLLICSLAAMTPVSAAAAGQEEALPKLLRFGFLVTVYHDIDPRDAQAATELLAREISRAMGLTTTPKVTIFPELAAMDAAIRRKELDLVSIPAIDYLRHRNSTQLIPALVGAHNGGKGSRFILIVRRDGAIRTFADLKGKSLLLLPASKQESSRIWLEVLLAQAGATSPKAFFGSTREVSKVSKAIMSVFFKQADAAVVTRTAFDTAGQLNPQIGRNLTIIAESAYMSDGVTCFPEYVPQQTRQKIIAAIGKVNRSATGRQLYTIFQTTGTTPFMPEYLTGLEHLLLERKRLQKKPVTWD